MLELTKLNGKKVFLKEESIESIEEFPKHTVIHMISGISFKVTDYCVDIHSEILVSEQLQAEMALRGMM